MLYRQERNCSKRGLFIIIIIFLLLLFLFFIIFILFVFILIFLLLLLLLALLSLGNYFFACINLPFGPVRSNILGGEKQEESLKDLTSQELWAASECCSWSQSHPGTCPFPHAHRGRTGSCSFSYRVNWGPAPKEGEPSNNAGAPEHAAYGCGGISAVRLLGTGWKSCCLRW